MKSVILSLLCLSPIYFYAQLLDYNQSDTRALVIGISDYEDEDIPDLKYAHKDARAYADFLKSKAGGSLSEEQIILLENQQATTGKIIAALDWLLEESKEGDRTIIYFSGHGDVETRTRFQRGYLLTHNTLSKVYVSGALPLAYLEDVIKTLSFNNVQVFIIADACHSGELAGSNINGTQATASVLAKNFANELKIMSCQPDEFSVEGEQWGGGRGVFSYHLIEGLIGLADNNNDAITNLMEIERYLEDNVAREVAPQSQIPFTTGKKNTMLSIVDESQVAELKRQKSEKLPLLASVNSKSIIPFSGGIIDSVLQKEYDAFLLALENHSLLEPKDSSAYFYYSKLAKEPTMKPMLGNMRRNLAAAFQDDAQRALNALLKSDPKELNNLRYHREEYLRYPLYIEKSIELLGENHFLAPTLKVRMYYFEAINLILNTADFEANEDLKWDYYKKAKQLLLKGIEIEPQAAYLYNAIGYFYANRSPSNIDSVLYYCNKALEYSPTWLVPYLSITEEYFYNLKDYKSAEKWLLKAYEIDPESYVVLENLNWLYLNVGRIDDAIPISRRMVDLRPDLFNSYGNLGGAYYAAQKYPEAIKWYQKALEIDQSPSNWVHQFLAYSYFYVQKQDVGSAYFERLLRDEQVPLWMKRRYYWWYGAGLINTTDNLALAEQCFLKSIEGELSLANRLENKAYLAKVKLLQGDFKTSAKYLEEIFNNEVTNINAFILAYTLKAELARINGDHKSAEQFFQKALEHTTGVYIFDKDFKEYAMLRYGRFLISQNRLEDARQQFENCWHYTNKNGFSGYYGLALLAAKEGKQELALEQIKQALEHHHPQKKKFTEEPLFEKIQETQSFQDLMQQHFGSK